MSRGRSSCLAGLIADRYLCTTRSGCGEAIVCGFSRQVGKGGGQGEKSSLCFIFFGLV
jgi:hypothetical protein